MFGKNLIVKNAEIFLNTMQKFHLKIIHRYREIVKNPKWFHSVMTSMIGWLKIKIYLTFTDLANIEVIQLLILS